MKLCIQRVKYARVTLPEENGKVQGEIGPGLFVLLGIKNGDTVEDVPYFAGKLAGLRIFEDEDGKMNRSLEDIDGKILLVSQFTLYADTRKGRRPSFVDAARPEFAEPIYEAFVRELERLGVSVETGKFQAEMEIELLNDGPVTIIIE